ncbi:MAG: 2'-5' RNA ligase family protein [Nanoarchaeota archaeon]
MRYYLAFLPSQGVQTYCEAFLKEIKREFNLQNVNQRSIPHVTLKNPFELSSPRVLEEYLIDFVRKKEPPLMNIKGFSNFDQNVLYLEVVPSHEMFLQFEKLINGLRQLREVGWSEHDGLRKKLHVTVAKGIRSNFKEVWNYASKFRPNFLESFNNISILEKTVDRGPIIRSSYLFDP